jgi:hypothetical protein
MLVIFGQWSGGIKKGEVVDWVQFLTSKRQIVDGCLLAPVAAVCGAADKLRS